MRFFRTLVTALLLFFAVIVNAQQGPSITINGEPVQQQVVRITFSGDNAVLHFSDGSQLTAAMQELVLQFEKGTSTIIEALKSPVTDRFLIQGLPEGTPVTIYDTQGKTVLTTTTSASSSSLFPVSSLRSGVYLLKAKGYIVKFIKQ